MNWMAAKPNPAPVVDNGPVTLTRNGAYIRMQLSPGATYNASQQIEIVGQASDSFDVKQVILREGGREVVRRSTRLGTIASFWLYFTISERGNHTLEVFGVGSNGQETQYGSITITIR
jgi:hypothetical protein